MNRDLRAYFAGRWDLEREIDDRRAGQKGKLTGHAVFSAEGEDLKYQERGEMTLGQSVTQSFRSYRYSFTAPGKGGNPL